MHPLPLTEQLPMEVRTMLHRLQIMELLLQTHLRILVDLQMSSFPTPMRQEPSTAILTDIHSLFSRTVTETGWILTEIPIASLMSRMHTMQMATAITGTEKQQTYIICLFSKRITKTQKRQVRDHLPFLPAGEEENGSIQ